MSWQRLMEIVAEEAGPDIAAHIESRALQELVGVRITITRRRTITAAMVNAIAPGKPLEAARSLGVHPSTIYRALNRRVIR